MYTGHCIAIAICQLTSSFDSTSFRLHNSNIRKVTLCSEVNVALIVISPSDQLLC